MKFVSKFLGVLNLILLIDVHSNFAQVTHPKFYMIDALKWRELGPYRGGRSCAVTGVPGQKDKYYMGSTGGGVWLTKDGGKQWKNISDGYFGGSIGAIALAERNSNHIWVGTGEETVRGNVSPGEGVWKSEDAGKSWSFKGLAKTRHISRIRIHPDNPDIVYIAAMGDLFKNHSERGVFKTTDGGKNWNKILFPSDSAGVVELVIHPTLPHILYATSWNIRRSPYSLISGGPESNLWKSNDGGDTWTKLKGINGLPSGLWGISTITISPSNPDVMYSLIEHEEGGLFKTENGGQSWTKINDSRDLRQRAWYFSRIQVDPLDPNTIYVLNVFFHKSTDGGKSFKTISAGHVDHHDLWIDAKDPNQMILANDGGAQISYNGGTSWSSLNNQPTAQFYRLTTDEHFPFRVYAAQQDNSTVRILHRTYSNSISSAHWENTAGGESGHIAVDPLNPEIVYGGSYGGYLTRYDHQNKWNRNIHVWPDNPIGHGAINLKYRFQWNFPILFSRHNPKKLFVCSNHVHLSENEGHSWKTISPDLSRNDSTKLVASGGPITKDNTSVEYYCTIFAITESISDSNVIWTGSDDGLVHLTKDGGRNWINVTPSALPEWAMINSLEADPFHPGGCYIAATCYKSGDYTPYLFKTEDFGKSWKKIVQGISAEHFTRVIRADRINPGLLYCGTERGIYFSEDDGRNWFSLQKNLPLVPITDIALKDFSLLVSTQGRGIWMLDDLTSLRDLKNLRKGSHFFHHPKPAYSMRGSQDTTILNAGINHPSEWMFYFYLDSIRNSDTMEFFLVSMDSDTLSRLSNKALKNYQKVNIKTGSNLVLIPFKYPDATKVEGMVLWGASLAGPLAPPGTYHLSVLQNKQRLYQDSCSLLRNFGYPSSNQDAINRFKFLKKCRDKVDEAHKAILEIRDLRAQMDGYFERWNEIPEECSKQKSKIDSILTIIENELYQTKMQAIQDPINYPIKLTNKLAHLVALYNQEVYPPTEQAEALADLLIQQIDEQLHRFSMVKSIDLLELNQKILKLESPVFIPLKFDKK
ncbi:MAG: glycosyl hydrolase [Saprospiraceae bacterium]|nr:glycosyl hydrolase [Saprospiraceae bacterium]